MSRRSQDDLEKRLRELSLAQASPVAGLGLWNSERSLEENLASLKAIALETFGPEVCCLYRPGKKSE